MLPSVDRMFHLIWLVNSEFAQWVSWWCCTCAAFFYSSGGYVESIYLAWLLYLLVHCCVGLVHKVLYATKAQNTDKVSLILNLELSYPTRRVLSTVYSVLSESSEKHPLAAWVGIDLLLTSADV